MINSAVASNTQVFPSLPAAGSFGITSPSMGKTCIKFIANNKWNILIGASAAALIAKTWIVAGTALCAYSTCKLTSSVLSFQTWIPRSVRLFLTDKSGTIVGIATAVALIATKGNLLGIALLIYSTYKLLDKSGFIPRKVGLAMECYFPWRALLGLTPPAASLYFASYLSSTISYIPRVERFCYEKFDLIIHKLGLKGPTLEAVRAQVGPKPKLTFDQICEILDGHDSGYSLDIAHCSRSITEMMPLSESDLHFEKLTAIAKEASLIDHSEEIISHPNFLKFLGEEFPVIDPLEIKKNPLLFVQKLAASKGVTPKTYATEWLRERFNNITNQLNGKWGCGIRGTHSKLDDAIGVWTKILPYLSALKENPELESCNERKSLIFKLALSSSSQQASDIYDIGMDVLHKITEKSLERLPKTSENLAKRYKFKVLDSLERSRLRIIQQTVKTTTKSFQKLTDTLITPTKKNKSVSTAVPKEEEESHILEEIHRDYLSFGFLPLSEHGRMHSHPLIQYSLRFCKYLFDVTSENPISTNLFELYGRDVERDVPIDDQEELTAYINQLAKDNNLSAEQLSQINEKLKFGELSSEIANRFCRLVLISMGILKKVL